ncbi:MAG: ABC transporter ATP-binding protein [Pseudomonadota bacterium]
MLSLKNLVVQYGGIKALRGVSLEAAEGTITCLIGANGAGKSTTLRAISGMVPLTSGEIWFRDQRIDGFEPQEIVEMGIGHVPEGKKLFLEMTVRDNLLTGAYLRRDKKELERDLDRVRGYFPVLARAYNRPAAQMSGGEQQMLAIARGLMSAPKILLLDEPSLGLSPLLTREVGAIIKRISQEGVTILLIEQNAGLALSLAKQCYVLETGRLVLEGDSCDLRNNRHVKAAYLGLDPDQEAGPAEEAEKAAKAPPDRPADVRGPGGAEFDHKEPADKPRKNRVPPEAPPRILQTWEPFGWSRDRSDRQPWDWEPGRASPGDNEDQDRDQDRGVLASPTPPKPFGGGELQFVKKVFKPKG